MLWVQLSTVGHTSPGTARIDCFKDEIKSNMLEGGIKIRLPYQQEFLSILEVASRVC